MLTVHTSYQQKKQKKKKLPLSDARQLLEINKATLCRYETGKSKLKADILLKMASIYNVSIDELCKEMTS